MCAAKATPAFGPDGALWLAWGAGGRISVARSPDLGRSFGPAVAVTPQPVQIDRGPDSRPLIAIDAKGRIVVAFGVLRGKPLDGQVFLSTSRDGGTTYSVPVAITTGEDSQRFQAVALDADGQVFAAWLDGRNRDAAAARGDTHVSAALAFAWVGDDGTTVSPTRIAHDDVCECCGIGVGFAGPGRPVAAFRNVFDKTVRDHAIITFSDKTTPGPLHRVSRDDWKTDACPHQGPSLAVAPGGGYHVTWYTAGRARRGQFYATSRDGGLTFSEPMPVGRAGHAPTRPSVLAVGGAVWLAWKEIEGEASVVMLRRSDDDGRTWHEPTPIARTKDASDHPILVANAGQAYLSWQTAADGYNFRALEMKP